MSRHIYIERETERKKDLLNISINIVTTYQQHLALKWIGLHSQTKYLCVCVCVCVCVSSYIYIYIYIYTHTEWGESNGNLPLRTCPGCSVPELYR